MADILETLIQRIQEGTASPAELDQARALLDAQDWGVGVAMVRDAVHREAQSDTVDVTGGVFEALGLERAPIGDAVRSEAGTVDVSGSVLMALATEGLLQASEPEVAAALFDEAGVFDEPGAILASLGLDEGLPLGEAVRSEAGEVDLADGIFAQLGVELAPVAQAVRSEAGAVDVSDAVLAAIGAELAPVGEAVRSEAGNIDIADAVMASLATPEAMPTPVVAAPVRPAAANNSRSWVGAALMAAVALVVLGVGGMGSLVGGGLLLGSQLGGSTDPGVEIASTGGQLLAPAHDLVFASAAEVVVEDLSFGDDVVVFQDEGDDGALILWVDEEVL